MDNCLEMSAKIPSFLSKLLLVRMFSHSSRKANGNCVHTDTHAAHYKGQKSVSESLEMDLEGGYEQTDLSTGSSTQVLCKRNKYS